MKFMHFGQHCTMCVTCTMIIQNRVFTFLIVVINSRKHQRPYNGSFNKQFYYNILDAVTFYKDVFYLPPHVHCINQAALSSTVLSLSLLF